MHITAQGPPVSEMTYTVSSGMLNSTIVYHTVISDMDDISASPSFSVLSATYPSSYAT